VDANSIQAAKCCCEGDGYYVVQYKITVVYETRRLKPFNDYKN
jgi:hypothetical protein